MNRKYLTLLFLTVVFFLITHNAFGFDPPGADTAAGPIYTFFMEQVIGGFGIIIGIIVLLFGGYWVLKGNPWMTAACFLFAGMVIFAEEVAIGLGAMYPFLGG